MKNYSDSYAVLKTTVRFANLGIFLGVVFITPMMFDGILDAIESKNKERK